MKLLNAGGSGPTYSQLHIIDGDITASYDEFGDNKSGVGVSFYISTCGETRTGESVIINKAQAQSLVDFLTKRFSLDKEPKRRKVTMIEK